MRKTACGFTLVEILVVVAVMAILGIYTLANTSSFGEDQKLKNASLDVQSFLRLAQVNATAGIKCQNLGTADWLVSFTDATTLELKCHNISEESGPLKTLILKDNITVSQFYSESPSCIFVWPVEVAFSPVNGTIKYITEDPNCKLRPLEVTLTNSKTNNQQKIIIDPGGRIYAQ